jgi:predicted ATPase
LLNYALCPQMRATLWLRQRRELSVLKLVRPFQAFADRWMQASFRSEIELYHFLTHAGATAERLVGKASRKRRTTAQILHESLSQHRESAALVMAINASLNAYALPETPARAQQELDLQIALGPALSATKGQASPEVEQTYTRARALCLQVGETPQLFPTLRGLCRFYRNRGALPTARELGEQLYNLVQGRQEPALLLEAHDVLGDILFYLGEFVAARTHLEQGVALTDPTAQGALVFRYDIAPGVTCLTFVAQTLWCLGYPEQAIRRHQEALALAQEFNHPHSLAFAHHSVTVLHHRRREASAVQVQAEALLTLANAQGFPQFVEYGTFWHGWALTMQGQGEVGLAQMHQGMEAVLATGQALSRPFCLVPLAEAAGYVGQVEEGLRLLTEALTAIEESGRGEALAEAYRLRGALLLRQATPDAAQAEACFQQARSWELRTAVSLSRLWQQQGKRAEARELLAPIYAWFAEGFDTADLQEAKALLEEL